MNVAIPQSYPTTFKTLSKAVSQRSFCIFCLNKDNTEEIFLGIGLAIGMGRPFLIIKHRDIQLPKSLQGYHGIIEYDYFSQLREMLEKYTQKFLSDEVFNWEGATYGNPPVKSYQWKVENSWQNRVRRAPHEEVQVFRKPDR